MSRVFRNFRREQNSTKCIELFEVRKAQNQKRFLDDLYTTAAVIQLYLDSARSLGRFLFRFCAFRDSQIVFWSFGTFLQNLENGHLNFE